MQGLGTGWGPRCGDCLGVKIWGLAGGQSLATGWGPRFGDWLKFREVGAGQCKAQRVGWANKSGCRQAKQGEAKLSEQEMRGWGWGLETTSSQGQNSGKDLRGADRSQQGRRCGGDEHFCHVNDRVNNIQQRTGGHMQGCRTA